MCNRTHQTSSIANQPSGETVEPEAWVHSPPFWKSPCGWGDSVRSYPLSTLEDPAICIAIPAHKLILVEP